MNKYVLSACRQLLKPIVKILLRNNVMHKQFIELSKMVYVEVAAENYGISGRPANASKVALITGIGRHEVKRIKDLIAEDIETLTTNRSQDRIMRILSAWHQDKDFLDNEGKPLVLDITGNGASFSSLASRYAGDIPSVALMKELKRIDVVEQIAENKLKVLKRYYMPAQSDPGAIQRIGMVLNDLGETAHHNLYRDVEIPSRFEGHAINNCIDKKHVPEFREFIENLAQTFLENVDDWLTDHEVEDKAVVKTQAVRLGMGTYWIQG